MNEKVRFPWRVSRTQKDAYPAIVDADGKVVARIMNGSLEDAERIVRSSNRAAEGANLEEV